MKTLEGFGILVGVIIGAGIFGLPYSFSGAPLSWNIFLFLGVFCLSVLLHLLFAGIIYTTPGKHRFPGYVQIYLGPRAETIATIFAALSSYGAMLAYGILGATFLQNIFGIDFFIGGILFFILGGALFFLSIDEIGKINFYLTLPLVCFILLMAFSGFLLTLFWFLLWEDIGPGRICATYWDRATDRPLKKLFYGALLPQL